MDINKVKSDLQMRNLYFSNFSFKREKEITDGEYAIELRKDIDKTGEHEYTVALTTMIKKEDIEMTIRAQADFLLDSDDYSLEESIIQMNTVAIMFPFIRSQIALMTSQPGMTPIVLPAINTQKLK